MIKFGQLVFLSVLACAPVIAASAEKTLPDWLQGRASDLAPPPPKLSSAEILSLCQRPHELPQLLENIKLIWERKLLVQSDFYRDDNLKCFFDGASIVWRQKPTKSISKNVRIDATVTADPHEFPDMLIDAQIMINFEKAVSVLPAGESYIGSVRIHVGAIPNFAWREVRRVFGKETMTQSTFPSTTHVMGSPSPGKVFVVYLYPGDNSEKYGDAELPQARFLLQQGAVVDPAHRFTPQGDDTVSSILIVERVNRAETGK